MNLKLEPPLIAFKMDSPERPNCLRKILEVVDDVAEGEKEVYKLFLECVESSQRKILSMQNICSVYMQHRVDLSEKTNSEEGNSSLLSIFYFYSKINLGGRITFGEMDKDNITMSMFGLVSALRDFNVIPYFLSKEDVQFLWKVSNLENVKLGEGSISTLDFDEFKDFIARAAVLAYNRPGMRRLLINSNGIMPPQSILLEMLIKTMKLDDFSYVTSQINKVGSLRATNQYTRNLSVNLMVKDSRENLMAQRVKSLLRIPTPKKTMRMIKLTK